MTSSKPPISGDFVLFDFYAEWCEPCKWVEPILEEVINSFEGKIILHKVDIDMQPNIAKERLIMSVPTLILYKDGKEIWRMRGFDTAPVLIRTFHKLID
jgi:thioredoxin 1